MEWNATGYGETGYQDAELDFEDHHCSPLHHGGGSVHGIDAEDVWSRSR